MLHLLLVELLVGERTAAYAEHRPAIQLPPLTVKRLEKHAVRMERQKHIRLPDYLDRSYAMKHIQNSCIREVPFACRGKTAIQRYHEFCHRLVAYTLHEHLGGAHRPHSMTARRAVPYPVNLSDGFHKV